MRKYRTLLLAIACIVLAILIGVLIAPNNEPHYNGRSLSTWLRVYRRCVMGEDLPETESVAAQQAILAIGTNALPFLLKRIQQEPPPWHRAARKKLPESLSDTAPAKLLIFGPGYEAADDAMLAFDLLGTNAAPAIPDLVALMSNKTNVRTVARAIVVLSRLGPTALPHLAAALANTNQVARSLIPFYIRAMARDIGTNACVPPLKAALQDPDPGVRAAASHVLLYLAPDLSTNGPSK